MFGYASINQGALDSGYHSTLYTDLITAASNDYNLNINATTIMFGDSTVWSMNVVNSGSNLEFRQVGNTLFNISESGDVRVQSLCLSGDCRSTWPAGGSAYTGGPGIDVDNVNDEISIDASACSGGEALFWDGNVFSCVPIGGSASGVNVSDSGVDLGLATRLDFDNALDVSMSGTTATINVTGSGDSSIGQANTVAFYNSSGSIDSTDRFRYFNDDMDKRFRITRAGFPPNAFDVFVSSAGTQIDTNYGDMLLMANNNPYLELDRTSGNMIARTDLDMNQQNIDDAKNVVSDYITLREGDEGHSLGPRGFTALTSRGLEGNLTYGDLSELLLPVLSCPPKLMPMGDSLAFLQYSWCTKSFNTDTNRFEVTLSGGSHLASDNRQLGLKDYISDMMGISVDSADNMCEVWLKMDLVEYDYETVPSGYDVYNIDSMGHTLGSTSERDVLTSITCETAQVGQDWREQNVCQLTTTLTCSAGNNEVSYTRYGHQCSDFNVNDFCESSCAGGVKCEAYDSECGFREESVVRYNTAGSNNECVQDGIIARVDCDCELTSSQTYQYHEFVG